MKIRTLKKREERKSHMDDEGWMLFNAILQTLETVEDIPYRDSWTDALQTFASTGDATLMYELTRYKRKVVDMEEFMFGKTYLNLERERIFNSVIDACIDLDTDKYTEAVLMGALGIGKSTLANIMQARALYKLSCMRDPQGTFGIPSNSSIVFTVQSVRLSTAKKAVFDEFGQYMANSPYFREIYPYDPTITSQMIFRENNVSVLPVSSAGTGVISMNVIGGILDEMNFMQKIENSKSGDADDSGTFDQATRLYETLSRRRKSRFMKHGKLPGLLFLVSSSRYPDDFTEVKAKEAVSMGGTNPTIYIYRHSQWSAKGRGYFLPEDFRVQLGTETSRPKLLHAHEEPDPNCEVIHVPMDFYSEFERDITGSIRDFAGLTMDTQSPFIYDKDKITACMNAGEQAGYFNIFPSEMYDLSLGIPHPIKERIRSDVDSPRVVHIDLGLKKDACGIVCGHVAGSKLVETVDLDTGIPRTEVQPVIGIDFAMRVVAPPHGEIEFSNIRKLLIDLKDRHGLPIKWITLDGYQSVDMRQILRKHGFSTDYQSVEKIEPYRTLRDAIFDRRVLLTRHQFLANELGTLEQFVVNNKVKVDHVPRGSKDVADGLCGVVAFLMSRRETWRGLDPNTIKDTMLGDPEYLKSLRMYENDRQNAHEHFVKREEAGRRVVLRRSITRK